MAARSPTTTLADIHPHIIQTHILPRLDGPSLSTAAAASSYLQTLCSDDNLWSDICKSTWPSVTHPRVQHIISTFPAGHRSFFQDSFPTLITEDPSLRTWSDLEPVFRTTHSDHPSELISAVDIRYQNHIVYSKIKFTNITTDFLSRVLRIEIDGDGDRNLPIDLKVNELMGPDDPIISQLKESLTLNWILIDPTRKRAGNLSSIKPVVAWTHLMTDEIHLRYVTVLPGCDPNEMVQCRIEVKCTVGKGADGLHVSDVILHVQDLDCRCLGGREFLVVTGRAISEENNVRRRKVVVGHEGERKYKEIKHMNRAKMEFVKNRKIVVILGLFLFSLYYVNSDKKYR